MGLFDHKKSNKGAHYSTLTESEIKKKLYGEFEVESSKIAGGTERDFSKGPSAGTTKVSAVETASDLFTVKTSNVRPHPEVAESYPDARKAEPFEKVPAQPKFSDPRSVKSSMPASAMESDSYQKFRDISHEKIGEPNGLRKLLSNMGQFFENLLGSNALRARQILYWTFGVLIVFLLLLGVNALNVQREQAMQTKYHTPLPPPESIPAINQNLPLVFPEKKPAPKTSAESVGTVRELAPTLAKPQSTALAGISEKPSTTMPEGGPYVIQVVTYPSEDYAKGMIGTLKQAGFSAFTRESVRPTGATFYIVYIGGFRTVTEAQKQLRKFRATEIARPFSDAFVKEIN